MSRRQRLLVGGSILCALLTGGAELGAQGRFAAVTRDTIAAVPGLQIVTIRDTVQEACYVLFMIEGPRLPTIQPHAESATLEAAAAFRDHQLQELSTEFERALYAPVPAVPAPNMLRYEWEGQKVQSEFDRAFLESQFARLEDWLAQIAKGPRLAVSGPAPCGPRPNLTTPRQP
jgi:hypothetical protein